MDKYFIPLYNLNESYHNIKERMIWLSATLYLGFSVGFITWYSSSATTASPPPKEILILFLSLVFLFATIFICLQNWYKCISVVITGQLQTFMKKLDNVEGPTYGDLQNAACFHNKRSFTRKMKLFLQLGRSGMLVIFITLLFFAAQISLILWPH